MSFLYFVDSCLIGNHATSSFLYWPQFNGSVVIVMFEFWFLFLILYAKGQLYLVCGNIFMMYMSVSQALFDLDLIVTVLFSVLSLSVFFLSVFRKLLSIGQLYNYVLYRRIVSCTNLSGMVHLTLTSFSWFIGQCLVFLVKYYS